ncbi:MAG: winged helix-turn-helix transcriptional regulator [Bacteroidales bacterium]|nr:winged helix-turn-helix transcriptional regulator [Bacteroidales bacterium]
MKHPSECIFFNLVKAGKKASRYLKNEVSQLGLTSVQTLVILFLFYQDQITSAELGKRTELDSATMTGVLDRIENMGFVARRPNHEDHRAISVCLTGEGRTIAEKLWDISEKANITFLKNFSKEEIVFLKGLLDRF